jgi:adenosylmethionine-8-amino-7-oxononanoate aminotransferase
MFAHGQTFAGQPLAAAVGLAVLDELVSRNLAAKSKVNGQILRRLLGEINDELGCFREVRGMGCLLACELLREDDDGAQVTRKTSAWGELGAALKVTSLENGLILRADGAGWFAMAPALCAEEADLEELASLLRKSLLDARDRVSGAK